MNVLFRRRNWRRACSSHWPARISGAWSAIRLPARDGFAGARRTHGYRRRTFEVTPSGRRGAPRGLAFRRGTVRGIAIVPLDKAAPRAALHDSSFYAVLALADAIRGGRTREGNLAVERLKMELHASPEFAAARHFRQLGSGTAKEVWPPALQFSPSSLTGVHRSATGETHEYRRPHQSKEIENHRADCHANVHRGAMHLARGAARPASHNGKAQSSASIG